MRAVGWRAVYAPKTGIAADATPENARTRIGARTEDAPLRMALIIVTNAHQNAGKDCCLKSNHTGSHCLSKDMERQSC